MKLLIQLFGETKAKSIYEKLNVEVPNMNEDYYIRNVINTIINAQ